MIIGLWHGAKWNFVTWGLYFAILLIIEKLLVKLYNLIFKNSIDSKFTIIIRVFNYFITFTLIIISGNIFMHDTNSFAEILYYLQRLFSQSGVTDPVYVRSLELQSYIPYCLIGLILSSPFILIFGKIKKYSYPNWIIISSKIINDIFLITIFVLSIIFIVSENYNPFIYFRF